MNSPRLSLIHPTSNPNSRNVAIALASVGLLHEIITTTAYNPHGRMARWIKHLPTSLASRLNQELERRTWVAPPGSRLCQYPSREIIRLLLTKTGLGDCLGWQKQLVDWVYVGLDQRVASHHLQDIDAIYAYEDGAATTFQTAKQRGLTCLYDLPIVFYKTAQAIQAEEAERFPELAATLQAVREPGWKLARKDQEIQLADHIFVASSITRRSLVEVGVPAPKISVIPYGAPIAYFQPGCKPNEKFRALFVGRVGARKGVHYLLQAWQQLQLPQAELQLIGINELPVSWATRYQDLVHYIPSVPHARLQPYYQAASVFVFPSLVEGFGLVLLEAMACGIPVITTPNTAGPDIVTDGVDGFIIPIRDVQALQEKLEWCYQHPIELAAMGRAARIKAEQLTWDVYQVKIARQVMALLDNRC